MDKQLQRYIDIINSELFKVGPIVVFIWENKENWPVLIVSENIQRIYGHKKDNFISNNLQYSSLIHEDDLATVFSEVISASSSNNITFEHQPYRLQCKDKSYKWVHDTTQIIRDENNHITHYVGYLSDITELKKLQNEYATQNQELSQSIAFLKSHQLAMDESSIVSKSDLDGNITYVNDNFCKVTGYTQTEVIGRPHNLLRHPSNDKETFKNLWKTIKSKQVWKGILQNRGKYQDYWVDISILPILDAKGEIVEYIAVRHDITKMIQQQQILDTAANTDTLTGYGNRYKLNNDIKNSINPALAILNIDSFSQVNDFYGHEKGDIVIQKLALNISNLLKRSSCKLYHLQGDEFVVFDANIDKNLFIENMTNLSILISTMPIVLDGEEIFLNFSTAISFEDKSKILTTADMALKIAKKENKNIVVYSDFISLNDEYQNNITWAKKIKYALENDKIVPVFQPIVNNKTKKWEKYEALVRLEDDNKLISPYFFLEISKKTKHYTQITKVMLDKSFEMFKEKDIEFSVNLTIEDILNNDIKIHIFTLLEQYNIGSKVVFEIVESESIENFEQIAIFIKEVKAYGCKIAIDDFGTGYSNFVYLMKVKADYIKIDGSMIKNIDVNTDAQMVVSTIVEFAKKMGMKTIAEFVENESILNKVLELGIDYTQGYYYSKPELTIDMDK
ncbi:MAG: EAL domain-containing protein [Arcobacteraceae bacterium]|jgi:PAS domain S-box-containing protein/diguanylate cyclase (GGDEF)-like protein|nr:EAL domain-containing protein [Arcobacteraceae bacterium]